MYQSFWHATHIKRRPTQLIHLQSVLQSMILHINTHEGMYRKLRLSPEATEQGRHYYLQARVALYLPKARKYQDVHFWVTKEPKQMLEQFCSAQ